jgi:ketosteroid isomerase-like protein
VRVGTVEYVGVTVDDLVAQQEIRDVLARYTRGIDRMDRELVLSCYHPGALDDHGAFRGPVEEFVDWVGDVLSYFDSTMHFLGQQLIEVDGDRARAETYCVAYHRRSTRPGEEGHDLSMGLRYVDLLQRRADGWRIAERRCVFDWTRRDPIRGQWRVPPSALRGTRDRDDPVYR